MKTASKKPLKIHFIITGGTIDSHYDGSKDTAVPNEESVIPSFVDSLRLYHSFDYTTICMKDSRALKRQDLENVLKTVEKSKCTRIIVTHGTYTMPDTARFLEANLKRRDQTILLTASAIPIVGFAPSDGPFNLGFAIAKVEDLPSGVYVAMNGRIFSPKEVMKVMSEARFASIFQH
jgi:L-asparaginase